MRHIKHIASGHVFSSALAFLAICWRAGLLFFLIVAASFTYALTPTANSQFTNYDSDQGLAVGLVEAVTQDSIGFIWIGGPDGLARFDGYYFERFVHDASIAGTLSHNIVWDLMEDSKGRFWVATEKGLNLFHRETNTFSAYSSGRPLLDSVRALVEDKNGIFWLATTAGLATFDPESKEFTHLAQLSYVTNDQRANLMNSLAFDKHGDLWIATFGGGVLHFNPATGESQRLTHIAGDETSLPHNDVNVIHIAKSGLIYIGTVKSFSVYDPVSRELTHFPVDKDRSDALSAVPILEIEEDDEGNIWVGTDWGLNVLDIKSGNIVKIYRNAREPRTIASNVVRTIFKDKNSDMWIGTFPQGVSFFNRSDIAFETIRLAQNEPKSVNAFLVDQQNRLWIGTDGGGLELFTSMDSPPTHFKNSQQGIYTPDVISGNSVLDLAEDADGIIWAGTWANGLNRINPETGEISHYLTDFDDPTALKNNNVWSLYIDSKNTLWVGTIGGSLYQYDREQDGFIGMHHSQETTNSISSTIVWSIFQDSDGIYWFGTDKGLDRYDAATGTFRHFQYSEHDVNTLGSNIVLSMHEDKRGVLWIGTRGGGLNRFDKRSKTIKRYGKREGFRGDIIASIEEDDHGNLWMGTFSGLTRFDPITESVRNYGERNGLQGDQFNFNASIRLDNGELMFGGTKGYTRFHPDNIIDNQYIPPIVFTDFQLSNESVQIGADDSPLVKSINHTDHILLRHDQPVMTFSFSALNYRNSEKNQYAYILEGFDKKWHNVGSKRTATYTNLDAGKYIFKVKASNDEGLWTEQAKTIEITILPPPWLTWWAYAIYFFGILSVIAWAIINQMNKRIFYQKQNRILEQRVAERTEELVQKEKLAALGSLVAGVAHELNTPIGNGLTVSTSILDISKKFRRAVEQGISKSALTGFVDEVVEGSELINNSLTKASDLVSSFKQVAVDRTSAERLRCHHF